MSEGFKSPPGGHCPHHSVPELALSSRAAFACLPLGSTEPARRSAEPASTRIWQGAGFGQGTALVLDLPGAQLSARRSKGEEAPQGSTESRRESSRPFAGPEGGAPGGVARPRADRRNECCCVVAGLESPGQSPDPFLGAVGSYQEGEQP